MWKSHVHVSLKNNEGRNIFSVSEAELQTGRANAANGDTKYISQEAEWFLAGILDGIADGMLSILSSCLSSVDRCQCAVMPAVKPFHQYTNSRNWRGTAAGAYHQRLQTINRRGSFLGTQCRDLWIRLACGLNPYHLAPILSTSWNAVGDTDTRGGYEPVLRS